MRALVLCEALVLGLVLGSISLIHVYWAMGGIWPGADKSDLKSKVLGGPRDQPFPSSFACLGVAGATAFCALVALGGILPGVRSHPLLAWAISLLFLIRGLAGFVMHRLSFWRESRAFNDLNQRIYSPLCLVVALLSGLLAGRSFLP